MNRSEEVDSPDEAIRLFMPVDQSEDGTKKKKKLQIILMHLVESERAFGSVIDFTVLNLCFFMHH